jgi:serine-type D-Ala-D-Ala carboxypeptidase/endopeptidase
MKINTGLLRLIALGALNVFNVLTLLSAEPALAQSAPAPVTNAAQSAEIKIARGDEVQREVQRILDKRVSDHVVKGIAVALILPNDDTRFVAAGDSGNAARPKIDEDTIFEIGSITKTFTATLLAQMVERGEVSLNDPLRKFAPKDIQMQTPGVGDVTLEQLSTHTSGLPRLPVNWQFMKWRFLDWSNPYAHYSKEMLWANAATETLDSAKKGKADYSNYGVALLGDALGNQAGTTWQALVQERITKPLQMSATDTITAVNAIERLAWGTEANFNRVRHWDSLSMGACGALRSSARDMAAYIRAQRDGTLAGAKATHGVHAKISERHSSGLGWVITRKDDDEIIWHNGGTAGFRSFTGFSKKSGVAVVVLANTAADVDDVGFHIINSKYALDSAPPFPWLSVTIFMILILWLVASAWFARLGPATLNGIFIPKKRFGPAPLHSKRDVAYWLFSVLTTIVVLHLFAPWQIIGDMGRWIVWTIVGVSIVVMIWRARKLPWRDEEGIAAQTKSMRAKRGIGLVLGGGTSLVLLIFFFWNLAQP